MILSKEQVVPLMDYIAAVTRHFGPDIQYDILYQVLITMVPWPATLSLMQNINMLCYAITLEWMNEWGLKGTTFCKVVPCNCWGTMVKHVKEEQAEEKEQSLQIQRESRIF